WPPSSTEPCPARAGAFDGLALRPPGSHPGAPSSSRCSGENDGARWNGPWTGSSGDSDGAPPAPPPSSTGEPAERRSGAGPADAGSPGLKDAGQAADGLPPGMGPIRKGSPSYNGIAGRQVGADAALRARAADPRGDRETVGRGGPSPGRGRLPHVAVHPPGSADPVVLARVPGRLRHVDVVPHLAVDRRRRLRRDARLVPPDLPLPQTARQGPGSGDATVGPVLDRGPVGPAVRARARALRARSAVLRCTTDRRRGVAPPPPAPGPP